MSQKVRDALASKLGITIDELRATLQEPPPSAWTGAGTDRWTQPGRYLVRAGSRLAEAYIDDRGATVHVYESDPDANPRHFVGSPLDGHRGVRTVSAPELVSATETEVWAALQALLAEPPVK